MKISKSRLKKVINEIMSSESAASNFYSEKARLLIEARDHLQEALSVLEAVSDLDSESPVGEDPDVQSVIGEVFSARDNIDGLVEAVEVMIDYN